MPARTRALRDCAGALLMGSLVLALRGEVGYLLYPRTALPLLAWCLLLAGVLDRSEARASRRAADPRALLRAVWLAPLALMGGLSLVFCAALGLPGALPGLPPWPELVDLPPPRVAPLLLAGFVSLLTAVGFEAARRVRDYVRVAVLAGRAPPRDPWAVRTAGALAVLLTALVVAIAEAPGGNLAHLRSWTALRVAGPERSLEVLDAVYRRDPRHPLADSSLYRMARLHEDRLGNPAAAARHYEKLLDDYPGSPWRDDALFALGALRLDAGEGRPGVRALEALRREHPRSPHRGEAGLLLARHHAMEGRPDAARAVLEELLDSDAVGWRPGRYPFTIARVAELSREELARLSRRPTTVSRLP